MTKYLLLSILFVTTSCLYKERPVPKPISTAETVQVVMGSDYGKQLFFDVKKLEVVRENDREAWDLAFENQPSGKRFRLNGSKAMLLAVSNVYDFSEITQATGLSFLPDRSNGDWDSTAAGNWWEHGKVLVINRGVNKIGNSLGFVKLKVVEANEAYYRIQWATLSGNNMQELFVPKDFSKRLTHVSLQNTGSLVDIEPLSEDWHLLFTTYTHLFSDGTPYLVNGVLLNPQNTEVSKTALAFENLNYSDAVQMSFRNEEDAIGYDWKKYDYDAGQFVIVPHCYVLRITQNRYFKLRFLDFYTPTGEKGAPLMEWVELIP
jgi:virulence-associated protein VagC